MRYSLLCAAAATAAMAGVASSAHATLLYGMETGGAFAPDGFTPNGGGTITKEGPIGVTQGSFAMEDVLLGSDATFVGALTTVVPAGSTAPGVTGYSFDLNLPVAYTGAAGTAAIGITLFQSGGIPHQSDQSFAIPSGSAGQFHVVLNNLTENAAGHPSLIAPFSNGTFVQSGFQFFIVKAAGTPLDLIIDNVNTVPEPASVVGACAALAGMALSRRRRRSA
jgi:hypothetical protein